MAKTARRHNDKFNLGSVHHNLANMLKINGNFLAYAGLHLAAPPVGTLRVLHQHSGFQKFVHFPIPTETPMDMTPTTDDDYGDLTALLGSRICHDLISPLGAIGNGVELLMMSGDTIGPEVALISQSVNSANARIRFFRVAFGTCSPGQNIGRVEILGILDDMTRGGRQTVAWQSPPELPRKDVKLAFLSLLCLETALPYGGNIEMSCSNDQWLIEARSDRVKPDPQLWGRISGQTRRGNLAAAHVQFALLPEEARRQGRMLQLTLGEGRITLRF